MAAVPLLEPQKLEPPPPLPPPVRQWYAETGTPTQPWFTVLDLVRYTVDRSMLPTASAERSSHQKQGATRAAASPALLTHIR